jgi:GTPase
MANIVAIIGRPNVGKSTFFNRLIGGRKAIVDSFSGVTRDRHYGKTDWIGREFTVIDTGGYVDHTEDIFEKEINKQVAIAIEEATVLIFMVDVIDGLTDMDKEVANLLRGSTKPVFLAANKADTNIRANESAEFYALGLGEVFAVSSINGAGTGDLLDAVVGALPEEPEQEENELPKIAVVGRPNAGKSSLINTIIGEDRNIVTDIAGTTRDSTDVVFKGFGLELVLVDTAGIRKKAKVHEDLEFYSVMRSINAIENSDVCMLMIDAKEGLGVQDLNIFSLIEKNRKAAVVVVNKWDLIEKETNTSKEFERNLKERLAPFTDIEIIFTSVLNKQRILKAFEAAVKAFKNKTRRIKTSELNEFLLPIIEAYPPPQLKGKFVKIKFVTQLPTRFPAFAFFCNLPQYVKDPYKRFLENKIRAKYNFTGSPMEIYMRQK